MSGRSEEQALVSSRTEYTVCDTPSETEAFPMSPRLLFVLALACAGCLFGVSPDAATLRLQVAGAHNRDGFNALDSHQGGMGGLHVTLTGAVERTFTAEDFQVDYFPVPDHGRVFVEASILSAGGDTIAQVAGHLTLEPDINWTLWFVRRQEPETSELDPLARCGPAETGCRGVWYSDKIDERHRNHEDEVLRLMVWRGWRCPEGSVC